MATQGSRLIDKLPPAPKPNKMVVIGLGLPRSGTKSIRTALNILGIPTYHTMDAMASHHLPYWNEALAAKYTSNGTLYSQADWSKLLHSYSGIIDGPSILLMEDWLAANPDAKIILNRRSFDSWWASLQRTAFVMLPWKTWRWFGWLLSRETYAWWPYACATVNIMGGTGFATVPRMELWTREQFRGAHEMHYKRVRALVPADRVLEFKLGEDGWEELCGFLGKEVPDCAFPRLNDAKDLTTQRWRLVSKEVLTNFLKGVVASGAVVGVLIALRYQYLRIL